jgi:hypothetical protein
MSDIVVGSANINYAYDGKLCSFILMEYETDPTIVNKANNHNYLRVFPNESEIQFTVH